MEPLYIVLGIILVIWIGIFSYMLYLDNEVKNLTNKVKQLESEKNNSEKGNN